jgi:competence protein ComEA
MLLRFLTIFCFTIVAIFAQVNINTATAEEFTTLKGIGKTKAEAIVEYRAEHGDFKSIDELVKVKGIGKKTINRLRDELTIDEQPKTKKETKTTKAKDDKKSGDKKPDDIKSKDGKKSKEDKKSKEEKPKKTKEGGKKAKATEE